MSNRSWKRIILGFIFLAFSIFYTVIFYRQASFGDTMIFNIAHLKSLGNIFTSPINFNYWNHSGSQINLFSPWLTLLPGWLLVKLNVFWGFWVYLTILTFLTFVSAYFYMNKFSHDTFEAILFSVIYTFSFNRFNLVFQNQRIENYLVLIFLPMVYYGAYLFFKNRGWQTLVWGMILTVWTAPYMALAVFVTILSVYILLIFTKEAHHWRYWGKLALNSLIALGVTILTTIAFIGPLVNQQWSQKLIQDPIKNIDYVKWFNNIDFSTLQRYLLLSIGVLMALLVLMIFLQSRFSYKVLILEMIPLTIVLLNKWNVSGVDVSRMIMALQSILDLFLIIVVCRMLILIFQEFPGIFKWLLLLATMTGGVFLIYSQSMQLTPEQTLSANPKVNYEKFVVDYHDAASHGQNQFLVNNRKTAVSFYTKENDYWVQYYGTDSANLDLPVQNYAGYGIQLNNENVATHESYRQTISLRTHPGKNIVEIHTRYDWIGIVSLLLNLLGFILLSYFSLKNVRWKMKKLPENS
ncbi:hypothetical protein [Companilactobacillus heilongjiangensis]|uniref:YfhO family protein n=1 Tax=Companilactobacillus heilongjiangensis TaxID=1074467 RepID=A0A0K2LD03_9LACO|nr:hypothetical protein [Companilactobacillus heilongjiangensis]ALB29145.1 hypothetical protein JP39_07060 [Companilactobacillus heilongjiangensis]